MSMLVCDFSVGPFGSRDGREAIYSMEASNQIPIVLMLALPVLLGCVSWHLTLSHVLQNKALKSLGSLFI